MADVLRTALLLLALSLLAVARGGTGSSSFASCIAAIGNCSASCGCFHDAISASYCACDSSCVLGCSGVSAQDGSCCGCSVEAVAKCHRLHDCDGAPCGSKGTCTPSANCAVATRPAPSCTGATPPASYVQHYSCTWVPPGTPGPPALCQPDSCGDIVSCDACAVEPKGHRPTTAEVNAAVKPVLEQAARHFNASFSFGWADGRSDASAGLVAGSTLNGSCSAAQQPCDRSLVPVGSTTKAWTGTIKATPFPSTFLFAFVQSLSWQTI
jgi:hypothetical protein